MIASTIKATLGIALLTALLFSTAPASAAMRSHGPRTVDVPSGQLLGIQLLADIGSRISTEGETFAVITVEDLYVRGHLVLPKGSPGYGQITGIKRSGMFHSGGEFRFEIRRLVAPDGTDIHVDMLGANGAGARQTERNGDGFGRYLIFGVGGLLAGRGNDVLVKKGALLNVVTENTRDVAVVQLGTRPAQLDAALISQE